MNGSPSVKVALFIRNGGSESPCRWFYVTGIYNCSVKGCLMCIFQFLFPVRCDCALKGTSAWTAYQPDYVVPNTDIFFVNAQYLPLLYTKYY